jgi:hypothetical protein
MSTHQQMKRSRRFGMLRRKIALRLCATTA